MSEALLIIAPTRAEYAAVRAALARRLAEGSVEVTLCGMGPVCATRLCDRLEQSGWSGALVLVGWAGGLVPDLAAGDTVLADAAVDDQGRRLPLMPHTLPGARVGAVLSVPAPLLTEQAKRDALASGALAVEMEAYPLAAWAAARNMPFVHARVILDTSAESLPNLGDALDAFGGVQPIRLVRCLLAHPPVALSLLRLARRVRHLDPTLRALARAVAELGSRQGAA